MQNALQRGGMQGVPRQMHTTGDGALYVHWGICNPEDGNTLWIQDSRYNNYQV